MVGDLGCCLVTLTNVTVLGTYDSSSPIPNGPAVSFRTRPSSTLFKSDLPFAVGTSSTSMPLSALGTQLCFDSRVISRAVVHAGMGNRSCAKGVCIPCLTGVPGKATALGFVLRGVGFAVARGDCSITLDHPSFPCLALVSKSRRCHVRGITTGRCDIANRFTRGIGNCVGTPGMNTGKGRVGFK